MIRESDFPERPTQPPAELPRGPVPRCFLSWDEQADLADAYDDEMPLETFDE